MDVRITNMTVEVFYEGHRVCSHPRTYGKPGQYKTIPEHMPQKHKNHMEWNAGRFISWAESIGQQTKTVIQSILTTHKIEQQGYRACIGVLKLADKYGVKRLESACERALSYTPTPSYRNIDSILKSGSDKLTTASAQPAKPVEDDHSFIRGAEYYGRKR